MNTILLIEDNLEIRENTAEILELANYRVITAENGKIGIEKALADIPDLIICDIMMPVLDGYGVLHLLNKNEALKDIPFIFLTAKTDRQDFRKGMEMGADDYITKPFTELELLNAIEQRLKKLSIIRKKYESNQHASIFSYMPWEVQYSKWYSFSPTNPYIDLNPGARSTLLFISCVFGVSALIIVGIFIYDFMIKNKIEMPKMPGMSGMSGMFSQSQQTQPVGPKPGIARGFALPTVQTQRMPQIVK